MNEMLKKIALCAMLVLILVPASVMAAGTQGQASGMGKGAGSGMQSQAATDSTAGEQLINSHGQGSAGASGSGTARMLRSGSCNGTCDQDMVRSMTRTQDHDMIRNMTKNQDMIQNMTRSQIRFGFESVLAGEGQGAGLCAGNGDGNCTGQQDGQAGQLQYQFAEKHQAKFGLTTVNGQDILASAADGAGDQDRVRGHDMMRNQTRLQDGSCGNCPNL
jgi:hypothetical protein